MKFLRIFLVIFLLQTLCLLDVYAQSLEQIFANANGLYDRKEYEGAIVEYRKVVDLLKKGGNPSGAQKIQKTVGDLYYELSKFDQAVSEYNTALALNKTIDPELKSKLLIKLGNAHYKQGHFALASKTFEELLQPGAKITPEQRIDITCDLADTYRKNEIYSKAIKYYQEALKSSPIQSDPQRQSFILTATGLSLAKLGAFDEAISNLQKALELTAKLNNPQNTAEIYSNIGIVYWDRGDYPKALENIKKAQEIEQQNNLQKNLCADYDNEGLVYKSAGNLNKALEPLDQSIKLAQSIQYEQGDAIATINKAIVKELQGNYADAMKDFEKALAISNKINFRQGIAACYQSIGNLYEIDKQDYKKAYEYYQKALDIFNQLGLVSNQANDLNDIGSVLKKGINRQRTTRDLIFEDNAPVFIDMQPDEAKKKSIENYDKALALATKIGKKEDIWTAHQGLGYSLMQDGKQEEAFKHYKAAIDTVLSMKGGKSDSELMGNYMKNKEGLFTEAIELLTALFGKTKNIDYLKQQMEYQEIYKNEVMKNAMATANLNFQDPEKAKLSGSINEALSKKNKLEQLKAQYQNGGAVPKDASEAAQTKKDVEKELADIQTEITKIDGSFNDLLAKWKTKYPNDSDMFDSAAKINFSSIQKNLGQNQALLLYFPMSESLNIICITNNEISSVDVPVKYEDLALLIRDEFHAKMEKCKQASGQVETECANYFNTILHKLYGFLILPIEKKIEEKSNLVIVPNKYISYVPFSALVKNNSIPNEPEYLVLKKSISYTRLSFIQQVSTASNNPIDYKKCKIIAVGNPTHKFLRPALKSLDGAQNEIQKLSATVVEKGGTKPDVFISGEATEKAWKEKVSSNKYNIFYFATHGVPYAEILYDSRKIAKAVNNWNAKLDAYKQQNNDIATKELKDSIFAQKGSTVEDFNDFVSYCNNVFTGKSPLYGFLYMADGGDITSDEGVLTLKEILNLDESVFADAQIAVLSACNTAVTFSPKVDKTTRSAMEDKDITQELISSGWCPGVDQVCLVDTFMKRNFKSVLGTFWMADDKATAFLLDRFMKNIDKVSPAEALAIAQREFLKELPLKEIKDDTSAPYTSAPSNPYFWAVTGMFGQ